MATVLLGLLVTGSLPRAMAHDVKDQEEHAAVARRMNHRVLDDASFDAAMRTLLCMEARDAVNKGQLPREVQQWILINGHHCQGDRLLFDAFGF